MSRHLRLSLQKTPARLALGLGLVVAVFSAAAGTRNDPELTDPVGDTFDEAVGQPTTETGTENVDIAAAWFQTVDADRYSMTLRLADLTRPPLFRPGRNVDHYEVAFDADGQRFRVLAFRDASDQAFAFIDVQGYSELSSPNSDDGDVSVEFDAALDELRVILPRAWTVTDGTSTRSFAFTDATVIGGIAATTFDGVGDAHGCNVCTTLDRAASERNFTFGREAVLVVLDRRAVNRHPPNGFSADDINLDLSAIGQRQPLRFFARNPGRVVTLPGGNVGNEGWFAPRSLPQSWADAGPTAEAARNYVGRPTAPAPYDVGPGLGTPDANGDRESLLKRVPDVAPLRATGLAALRHRDVCAVVVDGNVEITFGLLSADLRGNNLGTAAFRVISLTPQGGSQLPWVDVDILDTAEVCERARFALLPEAPVPASALEPFDTIPSADRPSAKPTPPSRHDPKITRWIPPWVCIQAPEMPTDCR